MARPQQRTDVLGAAVSKGCYEDRAHASRAVCVRTSTAAAAAVAVAARREAVLPHRVPHLGQQAAAAVRDLDRDRLGGLADAHGHRGQRAAGRRGAPHAQLLLHDGAQAVLEQLKEDVVEVAPDVGQVRGGVAGDAHRGRVAVRLQAQVPRPLRRRLRSIPATQQARVA